MTYRSALLPFPAGVCVPDRAGLDLPAILAPARLLPEHEPSRVGGVDVASFAEIATEFQARVARIAWATVATVGPDGAPRTRILHPIWEDHIGWIATTRGSLKIRQIQREPRVSLTYWDPQQDNVHIEAVATVTDAAADKSRIWDLFTATPPPLGYDPAVFWKGGKTDPAYVLLRLDPTRIELTGLRHRSSGRPPLIWRCRGN